MSLSKPENLILLGASALAGVILSAIINRESPDAEKDEFMLDKAE